ncbi:NAD(P)-dependent alcohol dehydrogenase [Salipaludibacillus daqingensis]|uniref:NAD(P)-dependent alcohol dehydrogenase n=1 Tax=Salipaludibacillus daqingensis TaxID=3041001 RepID=UPI002475FF74|nr:NAD(P)-dependent alcohol dehydrogenase [Salipaludibacillus daqingensis]
MRAITSTEFGPPDVLKLSEVEKPVPKDDEVLIRVSATSVKYGDLVARNFKGVSPKEFNMPFLFWFFAKIFFGFRKPKIKILGSEFAGEIESVGKDVTSFKKGDQTFGYLGQNMGAYAEYICVSNKGVLAIKPINMTDEEAAVTPYGAMMSWSLLRKGKIKRGQKVLIIGASGGLGSAAVQIAKHEGAEVTGVCGTSRLAFVKSLGADRVIDYHKEDFTVNGETYDLIFDILGKSSFSVCKNLLEPNGRYLLASFKMKDLLQMLVTNIRSSKKVVCAIASGRMEDLMTVKELIEKGKIKSVIDRRFPLEQTADAHRYVESGNQKGHVVITVKGHK